MLIFDGSLCCLILPYQKERPLRSTSVLIDADALRQRQRGLTRKYLGLLYCLPACHFSYWSAPNLTASKCPASAAKSLGKTRLIRVVPSRHLSVSFSILQSQSPWSCSCSCSCSLSCQLDRYIQQTQVSHMYLAHNQPSLAPSSVLFSIR